MSNPHDVGFDFDRFRNEAGQIDLIAAFTVIHPVPGRVDLPIRFLNRVQELQPIRSRQAAATAIAFAQMLADS